MSVFSLNNTKSHLDRKIFFDESVDIARYDRVKYPQLDKLTEKQMGFFWRPQEVNLTKDSKDFKNLQDHEKHIFVSNLKRQILLDSVQGRAPSMAFLPLASLPEVENFIQAWTFFETIHSRSYTHIIRNIYPDPSKIFDEMMDIKEIADCAKDISKYYDDLINYPAECFASQMTAKDFNAVNGFAKIHAPEHYHGVMKYSTMKEMTYKYKKRLWLCLNAVNALEGIRFYVSFAASWNFAEQKKMEGNAKIIKLIARDENVHLAFTQQLIKLLPKDDSDFEKIKEECKDEVRAIFDSVIKQEKNWSAYLFQYGSMIGMNETIACDYIDWIGHKRMTAVGIDCESQGSNPLPWTGKWIAGSDVQVAPQEVELSSYTTGEINMDVTEDTFKKFIL